MEQHPTILIVDDDAQIRRVQGLVLERAGYAVTRAASGEEALRRAREDRPDLVLLDIVLPDIDGLEVCRRLKADPDLESTFVALISGARTKGKDQAAALDSGADGSITRPIAPQELLARVETLLRLQQVERRLRAAEARYRAIFETAPVGIYRATPQWEIVMANPALGEMLRYGEGAPLTGMNINADLRAPDYPRQSLDRQLAEDGHVSSLEGVWTRRDGDPMFVLESVQPIRDDAGRLQAYQGTVEDITQRVLRERRTERRHAVTNALRDVNQLIVRQVDRRSLLTTACEELAAVDGYETVWIGLAPDRGRAQQLASAGPEAAPPPLLRHPGQRLPDDSADGDSAGGRVRFLDRTSNRAEVGATTTLAAAPLRHAGRQYGLLAVAVQSDLDVGETEKALLEELADDLALALHDLNLEEQHRQADEALQRSEKRYRVLFQKTGTATCVFDDDGVITLCNERFAALAGLPEEEIEGQFSWSDFVAPEDLARMKRYHAQRSAGEGDPPTEYDFTFVTAQGEQRHIRLDIGVVNETGERVASLTDLTPTKEAEEARQRSERRYRLLTETARDVIVTHDLEGHITYVNQSAVSFTGYTRDDLLSMTVADLLPPDERAALEARADGRANGNHVPYLYETTIIDVDGQRKPLEVGSAPIRRDGKNEEILLVARDLTERRRAQEALRASEERYRTLFEASPESITLIDLDGTVLDCNPPTERMAGRPCEELVGKPFSELGVLPSGTLDQYADVFRRLLDGDRIEPIEIRGTRPDGTTYWAEAFPAPVFKDGEVEAVQVITRDITDRKTAEQRLRERERLLAKSQEMASVGSWSLHTKTGEFTCSDETYRILGMKPGGSVPSFQVLLDMIHPDDKTRVAEGFLRAQREGTAYDGVHRIVLADGTAKVVRAESEVVTDAEGDPAVWYGIVHDITERTRAEKALRESEERYRTLFESSIDGIAQSDLDGNIVDCNQAYLDLTGHTLEEMKQLSYQDLTPKKWAEVDAEAVKQALERGYSDLYEKERIRKDGTVIPISIRIWAREDDNGKPVGLWGIVRDVSQRKEAEEEAERKEERLQSLFDIAQYDAEDVQDLLDYALTQAVELTDSEVGYIYHYHEDRQQFVLNTWSEDVMPQCSVTEQETVYDLEKTGIWGEAVRQRRPILVNDFQAPHPLKKGYPEGHVELQNFLTVPVFSEGAIVAVVGVGNKPNAYDDSDVRELTLLMDSVWKVVERRRAEEALAESERQLTTLLGNLRGMAYRCQNDPDWTMEFVSDGARALTGHEPDDLVDNVRLAYSELIFAEDRKRVWETIQAALAAGDQFQITYRITTADDRLKWVWEQGRGVFDSDGELLALEGFITDITERRRAEEALRESEEQYRTLFESSPEAIFLLDPDADVVDCNPAAETLTALPREDIVGSPFTDLAEQGAEEYERAVDFLSDGIGEGPVEAAEFRIKRRDGRTLWVEIFPAPIREGGELDSIQVIVRDVTERKEAQQALRRSEERYRSVFEEIPAGLYRTRPNGQVIDANPALVELLHYPDQESFLGINAEDLFADPADREDHFGDMEAGDSWKRVTLKLRRGDGEVIWVADTGRAVTDPEGDVLYYSGVLEDITAFKEAQEALRESEARNRAILDALPDLMFIVDADGVFHDFYATGSHGLYLPGEAFLGRRIQDVLPPDTGGRLHRLIRHAVESGEMQVGEYELSIDDEIRYFEARIVPHGERATLSVIREITERRRAEVALRESQERMDLALRGADLGTWDWDIELDEVVYDERWADMLGYSLEEIEDLDDPWRELTHPDDLPRVTQAFDANRAGAAELLETEFRMRHKAGGWVWVLSKGRVTERGADGDPIRMSGTHLDITERKRAEERTARLLEHQVAINDLALTLSETRDTNALYRAVYEHLKEITDAWAFVVSSFDRDTQSIHAEYAVFKGSEVDVTEFPSLKLDDPGCGTQSQAIRTGVPFYAPDFRRTVVTSATEYTCASDGSLREGPPPEDDDDFTRSALCVPMKLEGQTVGVMQLQSPRLDAYREQDKDTLTTIANLAAVAGQNVRLLERTREQAQRLQQTIDSVPEGMLLLDEDHRVILSNPVARFDLEVLAGADAGDVVHELGGVPIKALLTSPPSERAWHEIEADGRTFEIIGRPMTSRAEGERWVLVINDVTAEREVEAQLHQQERLAAVGQLAGGIAHDFNNILASIILYAQMGLGSKTLTAETDEALHTILEESHRAADLVQQILDFSRSAMMETKRINLSKMVQETVALLRRTFPENVRLTTETVSGRTIVEADATRIHQAVMNLALNAKDAMPDGGRLTISVDRATVVEGESPPVADMDPGPWASLQVTDTGTGLSEEAHEHLFEPFFTTKEPGKGTGLGLAQVYGIVKQHQGYIDVETTAGEGTTFTIYLPLSEAEAGETPIEAQVSPVPGRGETILVVEDAAQLRGAVQVGLESMGYRVIPASHGRQALEILARQDVDLVLTDVVMPEMGGKALLKHLRAERPELKIVAMTGHVVDTDVQGLRDAGFTDALPKPFSIEDLTQIVRAVLDD